MMRLYHAPRSPFARKVVVVLHETGQLDQVTLVPATGSPLDSGQMPLAQNPLGKIPALERDDGPALYDSRVICRYLDDRAGGRLYPKGAALWDALTLEATADGICDAAVLIAYETRLRPEAARMPEWVEGQWAKIARALDALETLWLSHLNGPLGIGQIAVGAALGYVDLRLADRRWRDTRPGLAAWQAGFAARPAMQATHPPE